MIEATLVIIERLGQQDNKRKKQLVLEQARYEVARARRQYDAADPVAAELERRRNEALKHHRATETELETLKAGRPAVLTPDTRRSLLKLGEDFPMLWHHPQSSMP